VKQFYRTKLALRIIIVAKRDLRADLYGTVVAREGTEIYRLDKMAEAKLIASSLGVQVILVDRDFPDAAGFIKNLRKEPSTRDRSIGVLIRGPVDEATAREWVKLGANAVFRMPADDGWDERFSKLVIVPVRQEARLVVNFGLADTNDYSGVVVNLSPGGMFLSTDRALVADQELAFEFLLPDGVVVVGRGRVARVDPGKGAGVEFVKLEGDARDEIEQFLRSRRLA
jgi:hypothetical protein